MLIIRLMYAYATWCQWIRKNNKQKIISTCYLIKVSTQIFFIQQICTDKKKTEYCFLFFFGSDSCWCWCFSSHHIPEHVHLITNVCYISFLFSLARIFISTMGITTVSLFLKLYINVYAKLFKEDKWVHNNLGIHNRSIWVPRMEKWYLRVP